MKNEKLKETKAKLKKYSRMKDLMIMRKKDLDMQGQLLKVAENELEKRRIEKVVEGLKVEIYELEKDILSIEKGISYLDDISVKIVKMKYMKDESWIAVALSVGYSDRTCKQLGKEALMIIGEFMYGITIHEDLPLVIGATYY